MHGGNGKESGFIQLRHSELEAYCATHRLTDGEGRLLGYLLGEANKLDTGPPGEVHGFSCMALARSWGMGEQAGRRTLRLRLDRLAEVGAVRYTPARGATPGRVVVLVYESLVNDRRARSGRASGRANGDHPDVGARAPDNHPEGCARADGARRGVEDRAPVTENRQVSTAKSAPQMKAYEGKADVGEPLPSPSPDVSTDRQGEGSDILIQVAARWCGADRDRLWVLKDTAGRRQLVDELEQLRAAGWAREDLVAALAGPLPVGTQSPTAMLLVRARDVARNAAAEAPVREALGERVDAHALPGLLQLARNLSAARVEPAEVLTEVATASTSPATYRQALEVIALEASGRPLGNAALDALTDPLLEQLAGARAEAFDDAAREGVA